MGQRQVRVEITDGGEAVIVIHGELPNDLSAAIDPLRSAGFTTMTEIYWDEDLDAEVMVFTR